MAARLPKKLQVSRGDLWRINPFELTIDEANFNGRIEAHTPARVRAMAMSLIEDGQIEPAHIRRTHGTGDEAKYELVLGFRRAQAVKLINTDTELRALATQKYGLGADDVFPLLCIVSTVSPEDAFVRNVIENVQHDQLSVMEESINAGRLAEMGYSPKRIASIYGCSESRISQLKALLLLSQKHQMMLHRGELTLDEARTLLKVSPDARDEIIEESQGDSEALKAAAHRNGARVGARPMRQIKAFLATAQEAQYKNPRTAYILKEIQRYIDREIDEEELLSSIDQ